MKRLLLSLPFLLLSAAASQAGLVISEIDLAANQLEVLNTGSTSDSLSGYWLCNLWQGSPVYIPVDSGMILPAQSSTTTLNVPAGGLITLQLTAAFVTDARGELGLYRNGSNFGVAANMVDYVCWGSSAPSPSSRDLVAASLGIWQLGTAIPVAGISAGQTIQLKFNEDGNSASDYQIAASTIGADQVHPNDHLVISEIDLAGNKVEILNTGDSTKSLSGFWFCNLWQGSPVYIPIDSSMILPAQSTTTTLDLPAGGLISLQLSASFITDARGELGLYRNANSFGDAANMQDYVCWGAAPSPSSRDLVAASFGIWQLGTFVDIAGITPGQTIQLKEGEDGNSAPDYQLATGTIGFNQVYPPPVEPQEQIAFRVRSLTFNGSHDLVIHFTPGEETGPFILTSSNDLTSPFTEETHAVYNAEQGTFTVPAANVNPFQDFYKVETVVE